MPPTTTPSPPPLATEPETAFLTADEVVTALEKKRRQIDAEIADFIDGKEKEYKSYASWLHTTTQQPRPIPDTTSTSSTTGDTPTPSAAPHATPPAPSSAQSSPTSHPHEREAEFAGLFIPGFLPLLDGRAGAAPPIATSKNNASGRPDSISALDASPRTLSPLTDQPPTPSVPTASPPSTFTSTSTPSDLSATRHPQPARRSSFRQIHPRSSSSSSSPQTGGGGGQTPRSPKRVMLAIDDAGTVVAPSASPLAERRAAGGERGERGRSTRDGGEEFEIVRRRSGGGKGGRRRRRGKGGDGGEGRGESAANGGGAATTTSPAAGGGVGSGSGHGRGGVTVVSGLRRETGLYNHDYDDDDEHSFETLHPAGEEEELFSFDDEGLGGGKGGEKKYGPVYEVGGAGEEDAGLELEVEVEGVGGGEIGSSPHAGSLPIEIRWPERRRGGEFE